MGGWPTHRAGAEAKEKVRKFAQRKFAQLGCPRTIVTRGIRCHAVNPIIRRDRPNLTSAATTEAKSPRARY
jgi:hypothetical protein